MTVGGVEALIKKFEAVGLAPAAAKDFASHKKMSVQLDLVIDEVRMGKCLICIEDRG